MSAPSPSAIAQSFSRGFSSYHGAATPQSAIACELVERLVAARGRAPADHVFEFGCGTGFLTDCLAENVPSARLTLNDLTDAAALTAARHGATFLRGDVRTIDWPGVPDLIVSASTIQWLADPATLLRRAVRALAPGGWLAVSGFGPAQFTELQTLGYALPVPGLACAKTLASWLGDLGLDPLISTEALWPMEFSSPHDVLRHLRRTGVNAGRSRPWTKRDLAAFSSDYQNQFSTPRGVTLSYHPVWLIARKPA
jgi:malonyl-CoA O-methyltransferase